MRTQFAKLMISQMKICVLIIAFDESQFCVLQILLLVKSVITLDALPPCDTVFQFTLDDHIFHQNDSFRCTKILFRDFLCATIAGEVIIIVAVLTSFS